MANVTWRNPLSRQPVVLSVVVVLIGLVAIATAAAPPPKSCVQDQQQEDRIRAMMADSLDVAFRDHVAHLFDIWVKSQAEMPERAVTGANIGVNAYVRAQRALSNWKPQRC
jgi:hypothetical protein